MNPRTAALWEALFRRVGERAGVPLTPLHAPHPHPIHTIWARSDLGLAFMGGWPFHRASPQPIALGAPVPDDPIAAGRAVYWTDMIVRADAPFVTLEDTFGARLAWTVEGSHSGYNAPRYLLIEPFLARGMRPLYGEAVGPVATPRGAIDAVLEGRADIAPLDGFYHLLLQRHEPATAERLRVLIRTPAAPIPLLVASQSTPAEVVAALRAALLTLHEDATGAEKLADLRLTRFAPINALDYAIIEAWNRDAHEAGYHRPY
ncbi:MAG: PhnD/SsuA/transferrin family substrate-binding protein [Pseudomonadota bacterium]